MPQLRWEGGKGAKLHGKVNAESSSEVASDPFDLWASWNWVPRVPSGPERCRCGQKCYDGTAGRMRNGEPRVCFKPTNSGVYGDGLVCPARL